MDWQKFGQMWRTALVGLPNRRGRRFKSQTHNRGQRAEVLEQRLLLTAELEPNDTITEATVFDRTTDSLSGWIRNRSDTDFFSVELTAGETLRIQAGGNDGLASFAPSIEVVDAAGNVAASVTDGRRVLVTAPASGTWFVRLGSSNAFGYFTNQYDISTTVLPFDGTTETEDNDTSATANALNGSTHFLGTLDDSADVDFFSFTANAGQVVTINYANSPSLNPATQLFAPDGTVVNSDSTGLGLVATLPNTGTYTFSVDAENNVADVSGAYVGQVQIAGNAIDIAESGNEFESATEIELGPYVVASTYLSPNEDFTSSGLTGSYINGSLRDKTAHDDWRVTETVAGVRQDPTIHFPHRSFGDRQVVGITGGTDLDWDDFSVQWDGYIRVVEDGTRVYTASDDGSRLWIDVNGDGVFASDATEFFDTGFGTGHGLFQGPASVPLPAGVYQIRMQYEEGNGANQAYLSWSDQEHSSGATTRLRTSSGIGVLSDTNDVDIYAIDFVANGVYEFDLTSTNGFLGTNNRRISLYNEFGQLLDYSDAGVLRTLGRNDRPETSGRHYIAVEATNEFGLGAYEFKTEFADEFRHYRDIPLFYQDYSEFDFSEQVPGLLAYLEAAFDPYQIDITQQDPGDVDRVEFRAETTDANCNGLTSAGGPGVRSVDGVGRSIGNCGIGWESLADVHAGTSLHTNGHGVGLYHARHPLDMMSFGAQVHYIAIGSSNWLSQSGDSRVSGNQVHNARNYLDWVLEAGRQLLEDESNDTLTQAQNLQPYIDEMSLDADDRNDQAVVFGRIDSPTDVDVFQITASAGQTFAFDIDSAEFQMSLDARLEILDDAGVVIDTNESAIDRDSGFSSVDPYLTHQFATDGNYFVRISGQTQSFGNYRLKVTPERAFDTDGPLVIAAWPDGGSVIDSTRQLMFWVNDQLDPATLTRENITVTGANVGPISGSASFDQISSVLTFRTDIALPPDQYTVTFRSGLDGVTDLRGNPLDGETDGALNWPAISGDGTVGGDFVHSFTVNQLDTTPAEVNSTTVLRHNHDRTMITLWMSDEIDVARLYSDGFSVHGAGLDHEFGTDDDTFTETDVVYDRQETDRPRIRVYTRGALDPGRYRVGSGGTFDAAGHSIHPTAAFTIGVTVPAESLFTDATKSTNGLAGSYVNESLRSYAQHDDWRQTQTISGSRVDEDLEFTRTFGSRDEVGITDGTDANWEEFSVQWDGVIEIPEDGVELFTRSDDGSRFWIDVNGDGNFASDSSEFFDNNWGNGQSAATGFRSVPLDAGTYRIRAQYEEGFGQNEFSLQWSLPGDEFTTNGLRSSPKVVDVNVQPNTTITNPPDSIDVTFSESIDATTLTDTSFRLRYSPDHTFFDGNDSFIAASSIDWVGRYRTASFVPSDDLPSGYYLIELDGDADGIASSYGELLDGEYRDANINGVNGGNPEYGWNDAPSGDGVAGGDYQAMFVLSADLVIEFDESSVTEGLGLGGTVTRRTSDLSQPLTVTLTSSNPDQATVVQSTVRIPAGQASATIAISGVDDMMLDGTFTVEISATAEGLQSGRAFVDVEDFEQLELVLESDTISESDGNAATRATVTRSNIADIGTPQTVSLSGVTVGNERIRFPEFVTIPAGSASVTFEIDAVNNGILDGDSTYSIGAFGVGYRHVVGGISTDRLTITDHETLSIAVTSDGSEGGSSAGFIVTQSAVSETDTVVALTVSGSATSGEDFTAIETTVTIPFGQTSTTVPIEILDDVEFEDAESISLQLTEVASGDAGFVIDSGSSEAIVQVLDDDGFSLDIDADGSSSALNDGILFIRHTAGFVGNALINGAIDEDATRTTSDEVETWMVAHSAFLDIDGDGTSQPLSDGILFVRYLAGFRDDALTLNAIKSGATRTTSAQIVDYLSNFDVPQPGAIAAAPLAFTQNVPSSETTIPPASQERLVIERDRLSELPAHDEFYTPTAFVWRESLQHESHTSFEGPVTYVPNRTNESLLDDVFAFDVALVLNPPASAG